MKKIVCLIILAIIFLSCSKDYLFNRDQMAVSRELKQIKNADQAVRRYETMVNLKYKVRTFLTVCDSLYEAREGNKIPPFNYSKIPSVSSQLAKMPKQKQDSYKEDMEEGSQLMIYVDNTNKERLYKLIKKYGYPSFYNRKWIDTTLLRVGIAFVPTHYYTHEGTGKKLKKLMLKEYFKGRVEEGEMKQYLWTLDGRNGQPYNYVIDKERWKKVLKDM